MKKKIKIKPLISIIIPTNNSQKYILGNLKSIFKQTYQNYEIIIIDNKSTDKTNQIINKYKKIFHFIYQKKIMVYLMQ